MKKFFAILLFLISTIVFPQVSVNTTNPQGAFHVDGAKDNGVSGIPTPAQQANDFVVKPNGSVGIGTTSPDASALMEINTDHLTSKKGVLPPKVQLQSETDNSTITNPANGLVVYHTGASLQGKGLYINQGSPASPLWSLFVTKNSLSGSRSVKMKYAGEPDPAKTISIMGLEFRLVTGGTHVNFEVRMTNAPATETFYLVNGMSWFGNTFNDTTLNSSILTFTSSNWNQWQTYTLSPLNSPLDNRAFITYLSSPTDNSLFVVRTHSQYGISNPSSKIWNQVVVVY